jgi:hypothetical protein
VLIETNIMASQVSCVVRPQKRARHSLYTTDTHDPQPPPSTQWTQSYKSNPHRTSFLDLPRELRDQIYTFALHVDGAIFTYSAPKLISKFDTSTSETTYAAYTSTRRPIRKARIVRHNSYGPTEPQPLSHAISLPLLRTCRQLHAECSRVLYSTNTFRIGPSNTLSLTPAYASLVKHVIFIADADPRLYKSSLDDVSYAWKRHFWPSILAGGDMLLETYSNLETMTVTLSSLKEWRPAFFAVRGKSRERRREMAVRWLGPRCWCEERLREVLRVEISEVYGVRKERDGDEEEEWDVREFAEAFQEVMERG